MNNIKAYYCKKCQKTTRHILQTWTDNIGNDLVGRIIGFLGDRSGLADLTRFIENEYEWKCVNCGRLTTRKADGTEIVGYIPIDPK